MPIGLTGNWNYNNLLLGGSIGYNEKKVKANGELGLEGIGSLNTEYDIGSNELHLYSRPSRLTSWVSKLGYLGCVGMGLLSGFSYYATAAVDDPYKAIGTVGTAILGGLISFFAGKKLSCKFNWKNKH